MVPGTPASVLAALRAAPPGAPPPRHLSSKQRPEHASMRGGWCRGGCWDVASSLAPRRESPGPESMRAVQCSG